MSLATFRLCLGLMLWGSLLFGALSLRDVSLDHLPGDWEHGICGPWGCGPPLPAILASHLAWLIALLPPVTLLVRRLPAAARWLGPMMLVVSVVALAGIAIHERMVWWPAATQVQQGYFWQRCGFVLASLVEIPVCQFLLLGFVAILVGRRPVKADESSPDSIESDSIEPDSSETDRDRPTTDHDG